MHGIEPVGHVHINRQYLRFRLWDGKYIVMNPNHVVAIDQMAGRILTVDGTWWEIFSEDWPDVEGFFRDHPTLDLRIRPRQEAE